MLPPSRDGQSFVTISPVLAGQITLPERFFVQPSDPNSNYTVPCLAFLIKHETPHSGRQLIMFDLGLRSSITGYTKAQQQHLSNRQPYTIGPGVAEVIQSGGHASSEINTVILSHVHYDHHGDPEHFPNAQFIVGPGSIELLNRGLGSTASHQNFSPDLLPRNRTIELPGSTQKTDKYKWENLGPFIGMDFLGDGSIFIVNSPGHLPGHINLLCRTSPERWVYLCGDAYHDRRLLTGERDIAIWKGDEGVSCCIHHNPDEARTFMGHLRELAKSENIELIGAHDVHWYEKNQKRMFPEIL